jgi:hypothetical protein
MIIDGLSWHQFSNLPHIAHLPLSRQLIEYEIYNQNLIHEVYLTQQLLVQQQVVPSSAGSAAAPIVEQSDLPSGCIEFVNNTSDGTQCRFWIETSAPTNYTITWGDGETTTGVTAVDGDGGVGDGDGGNKLEVDYSYADTFTEYTARICFDDISLVTYLEFNGDD